MARNDISAVAEPEARRDTATPNRKAVLQRQRDEFGGFQWGADFFGWLVAVTIALAVAGALFGAEYNVLSGLNLPRIPVGEGSLTTAGLIALAAVIVGTLLAAIAGGKAGTHFHRKVDRVGLS